VTVKKKEKKEKKRKLRTKQGEIRRGSERPFVPPLSVHVRRLFIFCLFALG
jgi:hypothetical protein